METEKYLEMAEIESHHWWFRGRRYLFRRALQKICAGREDVSILEIGSGTGGNLPMLQEFGNVHAVEMDEFSRNNAKERYGVDVQYGSLPDNLPFPGQMFDLICMFDVLEHIEDDRAALASLRNYLKTGGTLLLTVPATKWLYGQHDKMFHHYRRYSRPELDEKLSQIGFQAFRLSYFNTFLFPLAVFARFVDIVTNRSNTTGMSVPPRAMNQLFYRVFTSERWCLDKSLLPFGLSLMAEVRNP